MDTKIPLHPPPDYATATEKTIAPRNPASPTRIRGNLPLNIPVLNAIRGQRVILASASPRRRQLLAQIGLNDVEIIPSNAAEDFPKTLTPFEYVLRTAESKALQVYEKELDSHKGDPSLIIAADTVVVNKTGEILEKPKSEKDHVFMLKNLRTHGLHKVYTAVVCIAPRDDAVSPGYAVETHVEETTVQFDTQITDEFIIAYVRTREGADKAGGYAIQGTGALLVERIDGSYDNVVGLPLRATLSCIEKVLNPSGPGEVEEE